LAPSLLTTDSLVRSPSAKKMSAAAASRFDILPQILRLRCPSALVHAERASTSVSWHAIEARLYDRKQSPVGHRLKPELHQGGRLVTRVGLRVDAVRDPTEAEVT